MNISTTYGERLLEALKHAGKSRRQLAQALGITEQAVGNIVNGGPQSTRYFMANNSAEAAAFLGVDHYWLATGKGKMVGASAWPFANVQLHEIQDLQVPERLQLEGAMRMMLTQLWHTRNPGQPSPYKSTAVLSARGPVEEAPADLRALAQRQRQLEDAVRAAANHLSNAVDPPLRKDGQAPA
jgi:transcriptional regulator with XRE-family HTH domain